jgi:hypothetical protein
MTHHGIIPHHSNGDAAVVHAIANITMESKGESDEGYVTKGGKEEQKQHSWRIAIAASDDGGNEKAGNSDEGHVVAAERDFKRQMLPPKDHFEKVLEVACLNHSYPIKHKLKDCTMIKNFMTSGAFSKGRKPVGTRAGRARHPFLGRQRS